MNIFNTKKVRLEWENKITESYKQGKKDAINEALAELDKAKEEKENWEKLSEKELMIEIMNSLKLHNRRLDDMNNKINYISNYKEVFEVMNKKIEELNNCEEKLENNIKFTNEQVSKFQENVAKLMLKIQEIDENLKLILEMKNKIRNMLDSMENVIPDLEKSCIKIDEISSNMNNIVEEYADSPVATLNNIEDILQYSKIELKTLSSEMTDVKNKLKDSQEDYGNLDSKVNALIDFLKVLADFNADGIYSKVSNIESSINIAFDRYGYDSIYSKLNDIENKLN